MSFIAVAIATLKAHAYLLSIISLVSGILFWVFVIYRRDLNNIIAIKTNKLSRINGISCGELPPFKNLREAKGDIRGKIAYGIFIVGIIYFLAGTFFPYYWGKLGAILLFFLWAATFLPLGSLISYWSNMKGIPGLLILFIAAIIFSLWNDNHDIRELKDTDNNNVIRPLLNDVLTKWKTKNCLESPCKPFIVVATAGGGVRAAYWTATVLGELENQRINAHKNIFAISGVSGGSVGATVFRTVASEWHSIEQSKCTDKETGNVRDCVLNIIGKDTLGPVAASMLSSDLLQRFIPFGVLPDRAKAFENAWEKNYANLTGKNHLEETSFAGLSKTNTTPALFLNSTWTDNGRRIVSSTLDFRGVKAFERNNDLLAITGKNLRLSSAMHNSARFPFVSPPGSWTVQKSDTQRDKSLKEGDIEGRLMDGGLFENYGAETALEILDAAKAIMKEDFNPHIILISSDPSVGAELAKSPNRKPLKFGYEILSTVATYANARVGRGSEAAARLKNYNKESCADGQKCNFVHFHMCKNEKTKISPPLGWSLSDKAKETILGYLIEGQDKDFENTSCQPKNDRSLQQVISWVNKTGSSE